jgi:hypothetical protein
MNRQMTMRWMTALLCALCWSAWSQTNVGLTASVTPGKQFDPQERITIQKLNLLGIPTVEISGSVSGALLGTNSIGKQHLLTNVFDGVYLSGGDNDPATIIAGSIDSTRMASNSITGTSIVDGTVTAADVATNTLMGLNLVTNAFTNLTVVTPATNDLVLLMQASAASNTVAATVASLRASVGFDPLWTTNGIEPYSEGTVLDAAHGLGRAPWLVKGWLVCRTNDAGYVVGDMVPTTDWMVQTDDGLFYTVGANATNVYVIRRGFSTLGVLNKSTGAKATANIARWTLTVHAW